MRACIHAFADTCMHTYMRAYIQHVVPFAHRVHKYTHLIHTCVHSVHTYSHMQLKPYKQYLCVGRESGASWLSLGASRSYYQGPLGGLCGASAGPLGAYWGLLGSLWGPRPGDLRGRVGSHTPQGSDLSWHPLGALLSSPGTLLGLTWAVLDAPRTVLGPSWAVLGPS